MRVQVTSRLPCSPELAWEEERTTGVVDRQPQRGDSQLAPDGGVVGHVLAIKLGHRFVEVVAHQYRERQVQYEQQQDEGGDKPQG